MKKYYFIFILLTLAAYSCDLLNTRTPEDPESGASNFIPASDGETLLKNLQSSIQDGIVENYLACFVDTSYLKRNFIFKPASGSIIKYQNLNFWDINSEKNYFISLQSKLQQGSKLSFNYSIKETVPFSDSAEYVIDYNISINSSVLPASYSGSSRFKIFEDNRKQWVIVEWQDFKKDDFESWSDLKGRTY
jgi:hypothetical protein